jgi:hypothetical protein
MSIRSAYLGLALLAAVPARAHPQPKQDERVFRSLSADQLEDILRGQKIEFKKSENAKSPGRHYYDFKRGTVGVRLTNYNGKDLMLDAQFARGLPLEKLNDWNKKAKFSRVSLHQDAKGAFITLEYNLDVAGGITRGTVVRFLTQFDQEARDFERFLASAAISSPSVVRQRIYPTVTDALVEQVLDKLKVEYKKQTKPGGETAYDFTVDGFALRLFNHGGKDLMIAAGFRKIGLEAINKYNVDRKFVRAVYYPTPAARTALESNLDCAAGVSEEMVRYFITVFLPEVKHFAGYVADQP